MLKLPKSGVLALSAVSLTLVTPQLGCAAPGDNAKANATKPNVLLIIVDDLRTNLGCYGDTMAVTPRIDALSKQGVTFDRAYCQQAICAASRASFLTGLRPETTGILDLDHPVRRTLPGVVTLPQIYREAGYQTVSIGKVYHHHDDDAQNWTRQPDVTRDEYADPVTIAAQKKLEAEVQAKGKAEGWDWFKMWVASRGPSTESAVVPDEEYEDGQIAQLAKQQLAELKDKPFFLALGFKRPHLPFTAPKKYWDLYQRADFGVPPRVPPKNVAPMALPWFGELRNYGDIPKGGPVDDPKTLELRHGYYAATSFVDAQIGKVLDDLDEFGLAKNTVVVLMSDHGYKLGEYGSWCKHSNMEMDAHAPLIVRAPPSIAPSKAGQHSKALVEYVDLMPTLADLTGLKAPAAVEGISLKPLLNEPNQAWKTAAFSLYPRENEVMGRTIRAGDWRYTEWAKPTGVVARELYHHAGGDMAEANVADDPKYADLVKKMTAQLHDGWRAAWPKSQIAQLPPPSAAFQTVAQVSAPVAAGAGMNAISLLVDNPARAVSFNDNKSAANSKEVFKTTLPGQTAPIDAVRVTVGEAADADYKVSLSIYNQKPLEAGDTVGFSFMARAIGDTPGKDDKITAQGPPDWGKPFGGDSFKPTGEWKRYSMKFKLNQKRDAGSISFGLFLGNQTQTIEFADFRAYNFGANPATGDMTKALSAANVNVGATVAAPAPVTAPATGETATGAKLLADNPAYALSLNNNGAAANSKTVFKTTLPGETKSTDAVRVTVGEAADADYKVSLSIYNQAPLEPGDMVGFSFLARSTGGDLALDNKIIAQGPPNWGKPFGGDSFRPTGEWKRYSMKFKLNEKRDAKSISFGLFLGNQTQTVEFADFRAVNFGKDASASVMNEALGLK